ncbi:MAG: hypothetical protein JNM39_06850 [Bdellovibrionaceae bacterium]|nr:hypothetical protein [Pseudobdellovibrionaceae bacterium]
MQSNISEIIKKLEALENELKLEYEKLLSKYEYKFEKGKVVFLEAIRLHNKSFKQNLFSYIFNAKLRHILSLPIIYGMIFPLITLDLFLWVYQAWAFPLWGIAKVRRSEFLIYDRQFLDYLNLLQKVNCLYCSYANGLFAYSVEIAARTERYWCPIKSAKNLRFSHRYYKEFADYGDPKGFSEAFNQSVTSVE